MLEQFSWQSKEGHFWMKWWLAGSQLKYQIEYDDKELAYEGQFVYDCFPQEVKDICIHIQDLFYFIRDNAHTHVNLQNGQLILKVTLGLSNHTNIALPLQIKNPKLTYQQLSKAYQLLQHQYANTQKALEKLNFQIINLKKIKVNNENLIHEELNQMTQILKLTEIENKRLKEENQALKKGQKVESKPIIGSFGSFGSSSFAKSAKKQQFKTEKVWKLVFDKEKLGKDFYKITHNSIESMKSDYGPIIFGEEIPKKDKITLKISLLKVHVGFGVCTEAFKTNSYSNPEQYIKYYTRNELSICNKRIFIDCSPEVSRVKNFGFHLNFNNNPITLIVFVNDLIIHKCELDKCFSEKKLYPIVFLNNRGMIQFD